MHSKKTSKCQVFSFTVLENRKFFEKNGPTGALKSHNAEKLKVFQHPFCRKHEKIEENKNFYFRKKISQCRKKLKGGILWDFPTSILSQNSKKIEGGPFGEKIPEKSLAVPKVIHVGKYPGALRASFCSTMQQGEAIG